MKKLVLGALCIVLGFAANAAVTRVRIGDHYYDLDDETKTAEVARGGYETPTNVEIPGCVIYEGESYAVTSIGDGVFQNRIWLKSVSAPSVTSIGMNAFDSCVALTSVYVPSVTSIGRAAFDGCVSLTSLTVNSAMKTDWESTRDGSLITPLVSVDFATTPTLKWDQVAQAEWKAETTVTVVSTALKSGDTTLDKAEYEKACAFYNITPKTEPTAEDYKVVSKDAQVVKGGEIAVTKESIATAKAMTVQIVNGQVALGVSVLSNSDITASTAWAPVKFTKDTQIGLSADGTKLILPIPVAAQQGFMILQSGDAKVSEGEVRGPVIGEPWYKPTVED